MRWVADQPPGRATIAGGGDAVYPLDMSARSLILKLMPRTWAAAAEAESKEWKLVCRTCSTERSVWEVGGMRWKAKSVGRVVGMRCPTCETLRAHDCLHKPDRPGS